MSKWINTLDKMPGVAHTMILVFQPDSERIDFCRIFRPSSDGDMLEVKTEVYSEKGMCGIDLYNTNYWMPISGIISEISNPNQEEP